MNMTLMWKLKYDPIVLLTLTAKEKLCLK